MSQTDIYSLGLMSGTSLDGLDLALCRFREDEQGWSYEITAADCIPYNADWKYRLNEAPRLSGLELMRLHTEYGRYLADAVKGFLKGRSEQPDLIASHGHTIFHEPHNGMTLQIGCGATLSARTGLPVISDFRSMDVGVGGQGAPLVPAGDKLLFHQYTFCLNLGGIANISYDDASGRRLAYDVSPCNLLLNRLANHRGLEYDRDGELARAGTIQPDLLYALNLWEYYRQSPPKSLDKEALLAELWPLLADYPASVEDRMATVCRHIGEQIGKSVEVSGAIKSGASLLLSGGGALNPVLVEEIRNHSSVKVYIPEPSIIMYKEALIFAFLGVLRVLNRPNCLMAVTGADRDVIGGALHGDFSGVVG